MEFGLSLTALIKRTEKECQRATCKYNTN